MDNMLNCYILCNRNANTAVRNYTELYGEFRAVPSCFMFTRLETNLQQL